MSINIKPEAVFPPALYSLRRMAHQSPCTNSSKGPYDLHDSQQTVVSSFGEKRLNGISGSAPGSPASVHDYKRVVGNLQHELEESKRKGSELQQIITELSSSNAQSSSSLADSQFSEASSSNDSIGENVKDAHIKHLQRQVTVLQAKLYNCEGWANRVAVVMKERDMALDNVTHLTNEIKNLQGDNQKLQQRIETLSAALQEMQQNLHRVTEELQNQMYNGQLVVQLKEEAQRQKCEITTLQESLTRLDLENRSLKDSSSNGSSQSLGNVACSQELEHLHMVVDKLKDTVLEQRSYLIHMKKPSAGRNAKSLPASSVANLCELLNQDFTIGRKLSSPTLRAAGVSSAGIDVALGAGFGHSSQTSGLKSTPAKESLLEARQSLQRNFSASGFDQEGVTGMKRKLSSDDMLNEVFNLGDSSSPHLVGMQREGLIGLEPRPAPQIDGSSYLVPSVSQKAPEFFRQQGSGDMAEKNGGRSGLSSTNDFGPGRSPQHRTTQSEVIATKSGSENINKDQRGTKSEVIWGQPRHLVQTSANRNPILTNKPAGNCVDKFSQVSPGLAQKYSTAKPFQQEPEKNFYLTSADAQRQFVLSGGTTEVRSDSKGVVQYENLNRNSPTFQPQRIRHPASRSQEGGPVCVNIMTGGKMTIPAPHAHHAASQGSDQEVLYVNTPVGQGLGTTTASSSGDPDPSRARLNSNRLCPVCSNDYSHVSMEEFQSHVFECFDDENPPETMKPQSSPDRWCPMCNARFGSETTQPQFEKHVHGHFGEECPGDNFEVLLP